MSAVLPSIRRGVVGLSRAIWRQLTSMRIALILLFLLAVGSLPGALLPQWYLNAPKTATYIKDHPFMGPLLDKLGFFDVFGSAWFAAIYLLLAISLVGCIAPRTAELVRQWRAKPGRVPRNLARLPHHAQVSVVAAEPSAADSAVVAERADTTEPADPSAADPAVVAERIRVALRHKGIGGWRTVVRTETSGAVTVSAERGYLREVGNLVFHVAVLGLLFAMAIGSLFGYTGSVLVTEGDGFCASTPVVYDNFDPGRMVDGTEMAPFCIQVDRFDSGYDANGMAEYFRADLEVQTGQQLDSGEWTDHLLNINDPLRLSGQRLYLLGHGYVPSFEVHYPDGDERTYSAPFQPKDPMFTSEGVVKITDPPGESPSGGSGSSAKNQLAIVGIFAPSGILHDNILTSGYPELLAPAVAVEVYRGDLGVDHGQPQSIFSIDTSQVDKGLLVSQGRENLSVGQSMMLSDGTTITFTGAKNYVSLQTSYDPVQGWALLFAILLVGGILTSLTIKRRRVWYRITRADPAGPTLVDVGGLARTDQAGYGAEFDSLVVLAHRGDTAATRDEPKETVT